MLKINLEHIRERYEYRIRSYILSLRDIRNVGTLLFVILVLMVSWNGVKAIQTNYTLQKEVNRLQQENEISRLKNSNIKLQNDYYNTSQYLEVSARQNFGLADPGETVLLVPKDVALKYTFPERERDELEVRAQSIPFWQKNFRDWINFFFHR